MPTKEWFEQYDRIKKSLECSADLDAYFSEKEIAGINIDTLHVGNVHFPTGTIIACDPLVQLEDCPPYLQTAPVGVYPVRICVALDEECGDRYACVKVTIRDQKPVRYELAMTGEEYFDEDIEDGGFFGFGVDAGMGCIADIQTQEAYNLYWQKLYEADNNIDPYNDLFCNILEESYQKNPKYQSELGDWVNWTVPETDCNIVMFSSGWGDGAYPCYFGYDENNNLCGIYIWFIDIVQDYTD